MGKVPELDRYSGSWIVLDRETGEVVVELYNPRLVAMVNRKKYEVLTSHQHLVRFNKSIKE